MSKHLERDLTSLRNELLTQFGIVEEMFERAIDALVERRDQAAEEVLASDELVDSREVRIEEECLKILALHGPVARDLRWLATVIKINSDLERIGDLACAIADRALALSRFPLFPIPPDLRSMVQASSIMVRQAVDAFIEQNIELAKHVVGGDDQVDALNREVIEELRDSIKDDVGHADAALHCFSAARNIESIADLAVSIAEDVVYLVEGDIIRHRHRSLSSEEQETGH
jgi:phosphate transport system protein